MDIIPKRYTNGQYAHYRMLQQEMQIKTAMMTTQDIQILNHYILHLKLL